jgi:hypothetical protein
VEEIVMRTYTDLDTAGPTSPRGRGRRPADTDLLLAAPTRGLGAALILLGIGAAVVAVLGPLVLGLLDYHASPGAVGQIKGGDVAALLLVSPVSLAAGVLVLRRHVLGAALGLGPAAYGLYTWFMLATGGDPHRYEGNLATFFPLLLVLFLLAGYVAVQAWRALSPLDLPPGDRRVDLVAGAFLLVVATFLVVGLHLPGLLALWRGEPTAEYLADPGIFWVVKIMDLGLVVPLLVGVGLAMVRHSERVSLLRYAVTGWAALLGSSVAGMAVVMQATGAPGASPVLTVAFSSFALVAVVMAVFVHQPLLRADGRP